LLGPIGPIFLGREATIQADRRRSPRRFILLTQFGAQRSIRRWVVKSGRKWVQPRSNTDHQQQLFLWATHHRLSSGSKLCCEEITQHVSMLKVASKFLLNSGGSLRRSTVRIFISRV